MTAYMIISYDVSDAERFADYNPGSGKAVRATITKHGGKVLAAGPTEVTVGTAASVCVLVSFPDADAAKAWQNDDEYAPLKAIRVEATTNISEVVLPGF